MAELLCEDCGYIITNPDSRGLCDVCEKRVCAEILATIRTWPPDMQQKFRDALAADLIERGTFPD